MRKVNRDSITVKGVFNANEQGDVMDAFLTHACNEITNMGKNLLQMSINFKSITAKRELKSYTEQFIKLLAEFPPNNTAFSMLLQTFSSLAITDSPKTIKTLDNFFPQIFGIDQKPEKNPKSILSFYPPLSQELDYVGLFVGFVSEVAYAHLLQSLLENITFIDEEAVTQILFRIFNIANTPVVTQFQQSVILICLDKYKTVMKRITQLSFPTFANILSKTFPTKKSTPPYTSFYITSLAGISFADHNYQEIKSCFDIIPKLMTANINNGSVIDAICQSLCSIITNMKNIQTGQFLSRLERRAQKCLADKVAWASTLKLIGVIHYLNPLPLTPNYTKFLERFVFKRLVKPHKIDAALDYIIATLNPNECRYNWSPQTPDYIKLIYQKVFSVSLRGHELKAAAILESIAALDLPTFINERIPELLINSDQYSAVVMITFQRILNPLSLFQEFAKVIPTNAATGIHRHIQLIHNILQEYVIKRFADVSYEQSSFILNLQNINDILMDIDLPNYLNKTKTEPLSNLSLYYLLNWRKYFPINVSSQSQKSDIDNATKKCQIIMEQWMKTFDTPHNSFGDLMETENSPFLEDIPFSESIEINILPLIPILLHYKTDIENIMLPIFTLMISNDAYIAALANVIYQLIFLTFPGSSNYLISELCSFIQRITSVSVYPLHQLIQTYYFCLAMCKNKIADFDEKNLLGLGLISFTSLCSPFPETHLIGFQLIDLYKILYHLISDENSNEKIFSEFFEERSSQIESKMIVTIISEYSTWTESTCPVHRMPTISLKLAALSRYSLLWRFALNKITVEMMNYPLTHFLLILRKSFLKIGKVLDNIQNLSKFDIALISNIFTFLFATSSQPPDKSDIKYKKLWNKQAEEINVLVDSSTKSTAYLEKDDLKTFSFVFTSLNIVALAKAITSFMNTLQSKQIKLQHKESTLSVFATMLRHVSMQTNFDDYAAEMLQTKQIDEILSIFDTSLHIFLNIEGVEHYRQLFHSFEQFSHFLVFRGQYFRFLHQSKLEKSHCPIPRCSQTMNVNDNEISPRFKIQDLFNLLFKWSLIDLEKNSDIEAAKILESNPPSENQINGFCHAARVCLSFMTPIKTIFDCNKFISDTFLSKCAIIAKKKHVFLKHLLSKQMSLLLIPYTEKALKSDLETGTIFFNSITAQFIPTNVQDSMIYSHNTFIKNMSTTTPGKLTQFDIDFIQLIYKETGTLLLLDLLYLMHSDVTVRQNAMRMIGQVFPVIGLIHYKGESEKVSHFMTVVSKMVNTVSTQNNTLRIDNAVELSKCCSVCFNFATEQFLSRAFQSLPNTPLSRRSCSREQLLSIIQPWMTGIVFDLKNKTILKESNRYFVCFSPYSFVNDLISCNLHVSPYTSLLPLWQNLIEESPNPSNNAKFLTITLIDIAISQQQTRKLIIFLLTYIYRLQPQTINILVNLLNYSSWYFYNVQLGKYEIVYDMNNFFEKPKKSKKHKRSKDNSEDKSKDEPKKKKKKKENLDKISQKSDTYDESVKFALQALKELAKEDILPFIDEFNVIISFCLTHIHMKDAFDLLSQLASGLNDSFSAGSPECLWNLCELLTRINSVQFDVLRFVPSDDDTPLRALQKRVVSISDLLNLFIKIYNFIPSNNDENLQNFFLLWGLSCGDLQTAATALNLYSSAYTLNDDNSIKQIIESISIVVNCLVYSDLSDELVEHFSDYICAVFMCISVTINKSQKDFAIPIELFLLPLAVLGLEGVTFQKIVDDSLSLIIVLIQNGLFDKKNKNNFNEETVLSLFRECDVEFEDFKNLTKKILTKSKNTQKILDFLCQIPKLPKELLSKDDDYSLYVIAFSPFMCCSIEDPLLFAKLCDYSLFLEAVQSITKLLNPDDNLSKILLSFCKGQISNPQKFATNLIKNLNCEDVLFLDAAEIFATTVNWTPNISINCIYDLSASIMTFKPNANNFYALLGFTNEATINQYLGDFSRKVNFLQATTTFSEQNKIQIVQSNDNQRDKFNMSWINLFNYLYEKENENLHQILKNNKELIQIRFDQIEKYPPMFPIEKGLKINEVVEELSLMCKQLQVNPQTNWAVSIYLSQDFTDDKCDIDENPPLDYSINYEELLESIIEKINPDMDEENLKTIDEEKEEFKTKGSDLPKNIVTTCENEIFVMQSNAFLPLESKLDEIVSKVLQKN